MTHGTAAAPDPSVALMDTGRAPRSLPLTPRERLTEGIMGGAFLAIALWMALALEAGRDWNTGVAVVLVALFAVATHVEIEIGAGFTIPTQLAFVPMLLLTPTPWVPLLVAAGWLAGRLPDMLRGRVHPERSILVFANSWFAVGPALVLIAGDAQTPQWDKWWVYLLALPAQFVGDIASGELREWLGRGVAPRLQLQLFGSIQVVDALLSPLGLLAAFASEQIDYAFLLLVPPAAMLIVYARERTGRLDSLLALRDAERAAVRTREDLIAGASHEILTPLAILGGLVGRVASPVVAESPERRAQLQTAMQREVSQMRHLTRQFIDYTRLKAGRDLNLEARPTEIAPIARAVSAAYHPQAQVRVRAAEDLPPALADPDRVEQILMALVSNAVKFSDPGAPVDIEARAGGDRVEVDVVDAGRGVAPDEVDVIFRELRRGQDAAGMEGAGLGLYVSRAVAEAQGGELRVQSTPGAGSRFTLSLPRA